jgi:hypothetical protein
MRSMKCARVRLRRSRVILTTSIIDKPKHGSVSVKLQTLNNVIEPLSDESTTSLMTTVDTAKQHDCFRQQLGHWCQQCHSCLAIFGNAMLPSHMNACCCQHFVPNHKHNCSFGHCPNPWNLHSTSQRHAPIVQCMSLMMPQRMSDQYCQNSLAICQRNV